MNATPPRYVTQEIVGTNNVTDAGLPIAYGNIPLFTRNTYNKRKESCVANCCM